MKTNPIALGEYNHAPTLPIGGPSDIFTREIRAHIKVLSYLYIIGPAAAKPKHIAARFLMVVPVKRPACALLRSD
jgi:hypothetical protein